MFALRRLLLIAILLFCMTPVAQADDSAPNPYRLPDSATPELYKLTLSPDLAKSTFAGQESIVLNIVRPTDAIVLNAAGLSIGKASLTALATPRQTKNASARLNAKISLDSQLEQVKFTFPKTLSPGRYSLDVSFAGVINDKFAGFYRTGFKDAHGRFQPVGATDMEPTDARRMFPCFDEPNLKASFQITAQVNPDLTVISNEPIVKQQIDRKQHKKTLCFGTSPKMSTYLVCFVVGKFEVSAMKTVSCGGRLVPIRVWSTPGKQGLTLFAVKVAAELMSYFNDYFGVPYPYKKLDLIPLPEDRNDGMENAAAITFQDSALLVNENTTTEARRKEVARLVAHEMAHLWFGDLVTMKWWDDLWLKEGFADWISFKAIDHLFPNMYNYDSFVWYETQAMETDALKSTRPIHFSVTNPAEINAMFDDITYIKGAAIIRMLEKYLGDKTFQAGIHQYFKDHAFGNASTADLWQALEAASSKPVKQIMDGWINQPGYPVVNLAISKEGKKLTLGQSRFFLDPKGQDGTVWQVPVQLLCEDNHLPNNHFVVPVVVPQLLPVQEETVNMPPNVSTNLPAAKLLNANAGDFGYFRVKYPQALLQSQIGDARMKLSHTERFGLLDDQWNLFCAGKLDFSDYLKVLKSYRQETDALVVNELIDQLWYWHELGAKESKLFGPNFVKGELAQAMKKFGWQPKAQEAAIVAIVRARLLETLGTIGQDHLIIEQARQLLKQHQRNPDCCDANVLNAVTNIVAFNGGGDEWTAIYHDFKSTSDPQSKQRNLFALTWFQKRDLVAKTLELSISNEIPVEQAVLVIAQLFRVQSDEHYIWQFIQGHWQQVGNRCPGRLISQVVAALSGLSSNEEENEVVAFFKEHPCPIADRELAKTIERIQLRYSLRQILESSGALPAGKGN